MGGGWGGGGMGFGGLWMVLLWGVLIVGVIVLAKFLWRGSKTRSEPSKALQILEERYARGEINREEFEHKKRDLDR